MKRLALLITLLVSVTAKAQLSGPLWQDDGTTLGRANIVNMTGAGISCSISGATVTCNVSGGLSSVTTNATLTGAGTVASPLGIALGNANTWTGIQTFSAQILSSNGTASAPGIAFSSQVDMGLRRGGTDDIYIQNKETSEYIRLSQTVGGQIAFGIGNNGVIELRGGGLILDIGTFGFIPGSAIASAATIAPTTPLHHVTGTTTINTITVPSAISAAGGGCVNLVPDGLWSTGTSGNISLATTAVVNKTLIECWDGTKWNPSY